MGGIDSWRYSFGVIESWWYFLAVSRVGGIFLAEAVKPNYGGIFSAVIHYGGNVLAVGGFSFFDGNTLAIGCIAKIWRFTLPGPPTRAVISRREKFRRPLWFYHGQTSVSSRASVRSRANLCPRANLSLSTSIPSFDHKRISSQPSEFDAGSIPPHYTYCLLYTSPSPRD